MDSQKMAGQVISISNFFLRHLIASIASIVIPMVIVVITYFGLLVIAIITNTGLGGPIALPFWSLVVFIVSVLYTAILLFPSVLIAETSARIFGKWQHIAQIPISTLALLILLYAFSFAARILPNYSELALLHWANYPLVIFLILTIPLGLYWWTMKIVQTGISLPLIIFRRLRNS